MENSGFRTLSSKYISRHKYFTARQDSYITPTGKIVDPYFVVELPDSACAVAFTTDDQVVLIKQYRYPVDRETIELPGGFIEAGEEPAIAISRELLEETGYRFSSFVSLGTTFGNPGVLDKPTHLFLATGGTKTSEQSLDGNEEIEILLFDESQLRQMLSSGELIQSLHEVCLHRAFKYLDALRNPSAPQQ